MNRICPLIISVSGDDSHATASVMSSNPSEDHFPAESLGDELKGHMKDRLAKYEYPRELEFVDELPRTATGKIKRIALREESETAPLE
ncbi:hypothetical protein CV102_17050 [Natronococcus pandeyae]|uniref:AMP-binding enzyme C-terminal domain-containing protein n=1 Tax=Natronococcus pandeyae TaxID=2055836 RepID=A0A8J8Q1N4_9EURY|nr:acyl--CoA ligase [Natronococcus pandeyae]TYL37332.1 hypothetical protein CV102_17050 [Natronococcus pandeyae]